jgi:hypothetical protein
MLLMLFWVAWNLWLLCCFWDHLFWPASSWENEEYKYGASSEEKHQSRGGECLTVTTPREIRKCHLKFSSYICCSRRSPLECSKCKKDGNSTEGSRIGSGRILCSAHLQEYYCYQPERTRKVGLMWLLTELCRCFLCLTRASTSSPA